MIRWHRWCAAALGLLLAYVVATGFGIEAADMRALVARAPATDPDMLMMRQHIDGPPNYAVVSAPDYDAPALPARLDLVQAIRRAAALGRAAMPGATLRLVEVRGIDGRPAAHVQMGARPLIFDLATGARLPAADLPPPQPDRDFQAPRATFKYLHRFNYLGGIGPGITGVGGVGLAILIVTGLVHYYRLYRARARTGRRAPFWWAGDRWRRLHRATALAATLPILWLTASGLLLSADNIGAFVHSSIHSSGRGPSAFDGDQSSPLDGAQLAAMTRTSLAAFRRAEPDTGIKVLRIRTFAGYHQGVVVAADAGTSQSVFDARDGRRLSMSEPGYPDLNFPSGWEWHQRLKRIHRGDIFGLPGRWLDVAGGLSLLYLVVSGAVMYFRLWARRRRAGRPALVWSR